MSTDEDTNQKREFFRVPCEFQIRFREISDEELNVFKSFAMRPSPHSTLRAEVEGQLQAMPIRDESKVLLEKAFQILLNMDQRLERLEEQFQAFMSGAKPTLDSYEWVHGDLSAGGVAFVFEKGVKVKPDSRLLIDLILPAMPEYRLVAAAQVNYVNPDGRVGTDFLAIHEDDKEFIHRFVIAREREMLRNRALEREKSKESKT